MSAKMKFVISSESSSLSSTTQGWLTDFIIGFSAAIATLVLVNFDGKTVVEQVLLIGLGALVSVFYLIRGWSRFRG